MQNSIPDKRNSLADWLVVTGMVLYSVIIFSKPINVTGTFFMSIGAYLLIIYLFYGTSILAYKRKTYLLWGGSVLAIIVGFLLAGIENIWQVVTTWSMILFAGVLSGRKNIKRHKQMPIYIISICFIGLFSVMQMFPLWTDLINLATQNSQEMVNEIRQNLMTMGYSESMISENITFFQKMMSTMIYLIPASTIMGIVLQFSIGYLLFLKYIDRREVSYQRLKSFTLWKIPFGVTPVVIASIIIRLLGNDNYRMIADNLLALLSVFYCLAGLSVIEFYLKKLNVSRLMKVLFYLMLFFTQIIGYFVMVILGFIDSFTDWRKIHLNEIAEN